MRQILFGKSYGNLGGSAISPIYSTLRGYQWSLTDTEGADTYFRHSHPWSVPGTFKHFRVALLAPVENASSLSWTATTFIFVVNGVDTALTVTVPAAGPVAQNGFTSAATDVINEITVAAGDRVSIRRIGGTIFGSTNAAYANMEWTLTFDSDNDGESGYGGGAAGTKINAASNTYFCAPLNNNLSSFRSVASPDATDQVLSHSIVPLAGSLFRVDIHTNSAPGANSFTFFCYKNGVKQDGSGGTVDTTMTVTGATTAFHYLFDLPLVALNYLSIHIDTSLTTGSYNDYVTVGCGFRATTNGQSALCFNSATGTPITSGATDWAGSEGSGWAQSTANSPTPPPAWRPTRWPSTELLISYPGSPDPFTLKGFCINLNHVPGSAKSYTFTTRKDSTDTASTLTMTGTNGTTSLLDTDPMNAEVDYETTTDRLNIQSVAASTPTGAEVGWTWLMVTPTTPPPPPVVVVTYQPRWLRRFALPFNQNKWLFISRFELIMQAGVGLSGTSATQGYDPIVMFRLSRDGGQTWDNELTMSMGKLGEYSRRAFLNRLGRARNPVVELTGSDPVFVTLLDATIDVDEGTS